MAFNDLLQLVAARNAPVGRNFVRDAVGELTGVKDIRTMKTGLDINVCRGFFLHASNREHRYVQQHGTHLICLARGMNRCWDRLVYVKELMHCFDGAESATDSGERLETLLNDFLITSKVERTPEMKSELRCLWRALAVLCPREQRLEYLAKRDGGDIDDYAVALHFRIPLNYLRLLRLDVERVIEEFNE